MSLPKNPAAMECRAQQLFGPKLAYAATELICREGAN
jgi:hypothetical protein